MEENYYQGPTRWLGLSSNLLSLFGFFLVGSFLGQFFGLLAVVAILELPTTDVNQFQKLLIDFIAHPQKYGNAFHGMMALQWFSAHSALDSVSYSRVIRSMVLTYCS